MPRPKPPHLYTRTFRTKFGIKRKLYYVRFKTWQGNLLVDPAGDNEAVAIIRRERLRGLNTTKYDFVRDPDNVLDTHPDNRQTGETLQKWVTRWFHLKDKKRSVEKDRHNAVRLLTFFGEGPLSEITTARVEDYKLVWTWSRLRFRQNVNSYGSGPCPFSSIALAGSSAQDSGTRKSIGENHDRTAAHRHRQKFTPRRRRRSVGRNRLGN